MTATHLRMFSSCYLHPRIIFIKVKYRVERIFHSNNITRHPDELRYELNGDGCISQQLAPEHICDEITWGLMIPHQRSFPKPGGSSCEKKHNQSVKGHPFELHPSIVELKTKT